MTRLTRYALLPLIAAQAVWAQRRTPRLPEAAGERDGELGAAAGRPLRLLIVGDSSAAGVGVAHQREALAHHLAQALHARLRRPVRWRLVARSGANTEHALELLEAAKAQREVQADLAVAVLGTNDVVDRLSIARALAARARLSDWLRANAGVAHVVHAALPPMQRFPALPLPLRHIAGEEARRHDRALKAWCATRDDVSHAWMGVDLRPELMALDGFHPAEPIYRHCGEALARHIDEEVLRLAGCL